VEEWAIGERFGARLAPLPISKAPEGVSARVSEQRKAADRAGLMLPPAEAYCDANQHRASTTPPNKDDISPGAKLRGETPYSTAGPGTLRPTHPRNPRLENG
jgi:hypothetical protein